MSKYEGTSLDKVPAEGGSVRVTIANNAGRGNGGTSLPCKKCWIIANNEDVRIKIGEACLVTTGIPLPVFDTTNGEYQPLPLEIDDVASLYFYGATNDVVVDILYRL